MSRIFVVVVVALSIAPACVMSKEEGQQMQTDLRAVEQELAVARLEQRRKEDSLAQRLEQSEEKMGKISQALDQANQTTRKADADVYLKMDELVGQVRSMSGQLEELDHRMSILEQRSQGQGSAAAPNHAGPDTVAQAGQAGGVSGQTGEVKPAAPSLPEDKRALYDLGKKNFDAKDYATAREQFAVFLKRFADDPLLADNAMFWTAESYYQERTFDKAILSYQKVINKYPKSNKLDAALYKIGRSFESLGLKDDARLFYQDLVSKFPKSKLVPDAKKRIKANAGKKRSR